MKVRTPAPTAPAINQDHQGAPFLRGLVVVVTVGWLTSGSEGASVLGPAGAGAGEGAGGGTEGAGGAGAGAVG